MEQFTVNGFAVDDAGNMTCRTITSTYRKRKYVTKTTTNTSADGSKDIIAYTALAAARTVTFALAASVPQGTELSIRDWSNSADTNNINLLASGSDTIVGPTAVTTAGGEVRAVSDGVSKWYVTKG
jgi:hypothetical protein